MAKRTNGEGTLYQDKTGLWRGELTLGYDENNKRIKKQFTSMDLEVVQKKMNDEKFKLNRNMATQSNNFTVKEWLEFWLKTYKMNSVKPKTYDGYEESFELHVYNVIGGMKLDKLKSINIQQLYNSLHSRGFSTSVIKKIQVPLSQAMEQAIMNELIYRNPCKGVIIPKKPPRKSRAMTIEEQEKFLQNCVDNTYHNFFVFLLNTGMRCGEGMAIMWDDIDFENKTITVNKNMSRIKNRSENPGTKKRQILSSTKTEAGMRIIPINKTCLTILQRQSKKNIFVFSSKTGRAFGESNASRSFKSLLEQAGLPNDLTIHSLRHTFATRLLEKNANIKTVSELLGHKKIQITLDIYSHVLPNLKSETINLLN